MVERPAPMQKLLSVANPGNQRARVEVWLEHAPLKQVRQVLHAVCYDGQEELERCSLALPARNEGLGPSARHLCRRMFVGRGWPLAANLA
jgi:hypothetical protein